MGYRPGMQLYKVEGRRSPWRVVWVESGKRKTKTFPSRREAEEFQRGVEEERREVGEELASIPREDRAQLLEAQRLLPPGVSLVEAIKEWRATWDQRNRSITVAAAIPLFLASKQNRSPRHIESLRAHLRRFLSPFADRHLATIEPKEIRDWIAGVSPAEKTRKNYRTSLSNFFSWASFEGFVANNSISMLPRERREKIEAPELMPAGELWKLLNKAVEEKKLDIARFLILGAFAGLRSAEILRLPVGAIKRGQGAIEVSSAVTKTRSRRSVPILPVLSHWLDRVGLPAGGLVVPASDRRNFYRRLERLCAKVGVRWIPNGLRHTWISARLVIVPDLARVALEAGNSPGIIQAHYRELVGRAEAEEWFTIPGNASPASS